jgi:hypothetical protein
MPPLPSFKCGGCASIRILTLGPRAHSLCPLGGILNPLRRLPLSLLATTRVSTATLLVFLTATFTPVGSTRLSHHPRVQSSLSAHPLVAALVYGCLQTLVLIRVGCLLFPATLIASFHPGHLPTRAHSFLWLGVLPSLGRALSVTSLSLPSCSRPRSQTPLYACSVRWHPCLASGAPHPRGHSGSLRVLPHSYPAQAISLGPPSDPLAFLPCEASLILK